MPSDATHRRVRCEECGKEIWAAVDLEALIKKRGLVCPCTSEGSTMQPVQGKGGEVRL